MSDSKIEIDKGTHTTTVLPGGPAIFSLENPLPNTHNALITTPSDSKKRKYVKNGDYINWGERNNFPEEVQKDLRMSTVAKAIIDRKAATHVGAGLVYYTLEIDESGNRVKIPQQINEIDDFLDINNVYSVQHSLVLDLETYFNAMPYFRLNLKGNKIAALDFHKMYFCRFHKPVNNRIKKVCYSYDFPNPKDDNVTTYDIFNAIKPFNSKHFVKPLKYASSDETLIYELAIWDSVRQNGWMSVEQMVPELKKHIFANQAILKYHIKIPYDYWTRKYGEAWSTMKTTDRNKLVEKEQVEMNDFLSGTKNSGKSFISFYGHDKITGKPYPGFEITAVDNKLKAEDYLPDASAAINAICFAMGYDPTNMGSVLSDKRGSSGSGSDKREALANMQAAALPNRYRSLEPLRLITRVNKWNEAYNTELKGRPLQWSYLDLDSSQTLNQVSPSDRVPGGKSEETLNS